MTSIYEVIHDNYFKVVKFFPTKFLEQCKKNQNEPQNIPNEVEAAFKKALVKRLYTQVVVIHRRESDDEIERYKKKYR